MNNLLEAISSEDGAIKQMIGSPSDGKPGFIDNQYGLFKKQHDGTKFVNYVTHSLNVLQALRWLGYGDYQYWHSEDEHEDDELDEIDKISTSKLRCNARDVQIYIFAFLISTTRMLIKNFEDTNVQIMLDMKFPSDQPYKSEEGTMGIDALWDISKHELQSKIIKFAECFENPQVRGTIKDKIRKEAALIIHTVDFSKPVDTRFDSQRPKAWILNERHIGFELEEEEYKKLWDKCELFHLLRVKRYVMLTSNRNRNRGNTGNGAIKR